MAFRTLSTRVNREKDCAFRFLGLYFGARGFGRTAIAHSVDCLCGVRATSKLEDGYFQFSIPAYAATGYQSGSRMETGSRNDELLRPTLPFRSDNQSSFEFHTSTRYLSKTRE